MLQFLWQIQDKGTLCAGFWLRTECVSLQIESTSIVYLYNELITNAATNKSGTTMRMKPKDTFQSYLRLPTNLITISISISSDHWGKMENDSSTFKLRWLTKMSPWAFFLEQKMETGMETTNLLDRRRINRNDLKDARDPQPCYHVETAWVASPAALQQPVRILILRWFCAPIPWEKNLTFTQIYSLFFHKYTICTSQTPNV